ncbi:unnamed protein product [Adineta steineri]|uniref:Uncharacterized protein n=1 Tax=Adineta steineri TaxID=433720 RepID=A0A815RSZ9_9BILA|nr:unnamed protein product [Adineta steineri]
MHGHVFIYYHVGFITQHDQILVIQITQRLLTTPKLYIQQFVDGTNLNECETMQTQLPNTFHHLDNNQVIERHEPIEPNYEVLIILSTVGT